MPTLLRVHALSARSKTAAAEFEMMRVKARSPITHATSTDIPAGVGGSENKKA